MKFCIAIATVALSSAIAPADDQSTTQSAPADVPIFRADAVALIQGNDTPGDPTIFLDHFGIRYLFASQENRNELLRDPAKYEIQFGGACGRMGPLTGAGDPQIYAVHDQHLYIFASEACRSGFLTAPDKLMERDDPKPTVDPVARDKAKALLELALKGAGGAERIDAVKSFRIVSEKKTDAGGKMVVTTKSWIAQLPGDVRMEETWGDWTWAATATDAAGPNASGFFELDDGGRPPLHPQQIRALRREFQHNIICILQARTRPDFVAVAAGNEKVDGKAVDLLTVYYDGAASTLGLDPKSGELRSIRYRGRGPRAAFGDLQLIYDDHKAVSGINLPRTVQVIFDGKPAPSMNTRFKDIEINPDLSETLFKHP